MLARSTALVGVAATGSGRALAWVATSVALVALLGHKAPWPAAGRAQRMTARSFADGDVAHLLGVIVAMITVGDVDLRVIGAEAAALDAESVASISALTVVAFLLVVAGKKKSSASLLFLAMAVLYTTSMPYVADTLMGRLESDYPPVMITEIPRSKCAVLLGGSVEPVLPPRIDIDMLEGVDRVRKTAQLYREGLVELIIVTGGNQPWTPFEESESEAMQTLLLEWGVPAEVIHLESSSRNTRENAF